jgi:hypothetical protein
MAKDQRFDRFVGQRVGPGHRRQRAVDAQHRRQADLQVKVGSLSLDNFFE